MPTATIEKEETSFDLGTAKGLKNYRDTYNNEDADIEDYIKDGKPPALSIAGSQKYPQRSATLLFNLGGNTVFVINGIVYEGAVFPALRGHPIELTAKDFREDVELSLESNFNVIGVIVDVPQGTSKKTLIRCGDEDANYLVNELGSSDYPTLSFAVLSEFYKGITSKQIADWFKSGRLSLVDYTPDDTQKLTPAQKKAFADAERTGNHKLEPIGPLGFSYVGEEWHRSATCLVYDKKSQMTIIVGQDEGSYFGCELPTNPKTIAKAFNDLMPESVKGKKYQRQGEWFVVYVADRNVPKHLPITGGEDAIGIRIGGCISLPKETPDSNDHTLDNYIQVCITLDGQIYVKGGSLRHDEHNTVEWGKDQWVTFVKNTAKRSFSTEGVD